MSRFTNMGQACLLGVILTCGLFVATGCSDPALPTADEMMAFNKLAPDPDPPDPALKAAGLPTGPYSLVAGDLLELQMPQVLKAVFPDAPSIFEIKPLACRVSDEGTITLPSVGELKVGGKTLMEVEATIVNAYYPKFVLNRPTVVVQVTEYRTAKVSVYGAVDKPGVYDLRSDEMSLVAALMKAGGVTKDGARTIHIRPSGSDDPKDETLLTVAGANIPAVNTALEGGESIVVEKLDLTKTFTVVGLVNKPGTYPYPPDANYNLLQVLGFAGGLDDKSEPDFLRLCRHDDSGKCVNIVVKVGNSDLAKSATVPVYPGDAVYVEQTPSTRSRRAFTSIVERFGMYINGSVPMFGGH